MAKDKGKLPRGAVEFVHGLLAAGVPPAAMERVTAREYAIHGFEAAAIAAAIAQNGSLSSGTLSLLTYRPICIGMKVPASERCRTDEDFMKCCHQSAAFWNLAMNNRHVQPPAPEKNLTMVSMRKGSPVRDVIDHARDLSRYEIKEKHEPDFSAAVFEKGMAIGLAQALEALKLMQFSVIEPMNIGGSVSILVDLLLEERGPPRRTDRALKLLRCQKVADRAYASEHLTLDLTSVHKEVIPHGSILGLSNISWWNPEPVK